MAKDPVCGMFVEEGEHALKVTRKGTTYYFCSDSCVQTFLQPEVEARRLRRLTLFSFALGIPALFFTWVTPFPLPTLNNDVWLFLLATPVQFIAGWRFYKGFYHTIKARAANMDTLIAIGSGTDVAVETGGIVLIKDDVRDVVTSIQLSKRTMSKIKQNLFWAFAYNTGLIPVAALGLLNPILAGAAMALSSVSVVTNSLTLRRFVPAGYRA